MRKTFIYIKFAVKAIIRHPKPNTISSIIKYAGSWFHYLQPERNSLSERMCWVCFSAIEQIKKIVKPDMTIFEYGSGGSTLFWASRVKKVISIEHDKPWHEKMQHQLSDLNINNIAYFLIEPEFDTNFAKKDPANPLDYVSADEAYTEKHFEHYVKKIDEFPDNFFDIVVVDGRARPSCIHHARPKLKKTGYLIIDNTDREHYLPSVQFEKQNWKRWDYYGPVPFMYNFSQTSILQKI